MVHVAAVFAVALLPTALALNPLKSYFTGGRYVAFFTNQGRMQSAGSTYVSLGETNFGGITESNACKWETIEPTQGKFNYAGCDWSHNWITTRGGKFRGHTLVWHSQLAPWVNNLKGAAVEAAMKSHIDNVMGHYKGKVYAWDVVNEAINDSNGSLRTSAFFNAMGAEFITKAFRYARAADPAAKLYYNDYGIEFSGAKQEAAYKLVQGLKAQGLIDGVGFQGHFDVGKLPSNLKATVQRFANLGVDVAFTEVDIGTKSKDFTQQAIDYATLTTACVSVSRCVGITIGGIRDNESQYWRVGENTLLWNEQYQAKPALQAVANAAAAGTGGGTAPPTTTGPTPPPTTTQPPTGSTVPQYGQCGGKDYTGSKTCTSPFKCVAANEFYSQCL